MNSNHTVTSREYKLILNPKKFKDRDKGANEFWDFILPIIKAHKGKIVKVQNTKEEKRKTWYMDTKDFELRKNHKTILRIRFEKDAKPGKQFKTTLKVRAADRYYAASCPWIGISKKLKFEEDITPQYVKNNDLKAFMEENHFQFDEDNPSTFSSKFSLSDSVKQERNPEIHTVQKATKLFPLLKKLKTNKEELRTVNGFKAYEIYRKLAQIKFGDATVVNLGLSFWHESARYTGKPIVAEFSFDFEAVQTKMKNNEAKPLKSELEQFNVTTIVHANSLFRALQSHTSWFIFDRVTTKTAFAYDSK